MKRRSEADRASGVFRVEVVVTELFLRDSQSRLPEKTQWLGEAVMKKLELVRLFDKAFAEVESLVPSGEDLSGLEEAVLGLALGTLSTPHEILDRIYRELSSGKPLKDVLAKFRFEAKIL